MAANRPKDAKQEQEVRYSNNDLRERLRPFIKKELERYQSINPRESAWSFYKEQKTFCQEFGIQAIIHVIEDQLKHMLNQKGHGTREQLVLPGVLGGYDIPEYFCFRTDVGQQRYIPASDAEWMHICSWADQKAEIARKAFLQKEEAFRLKDFLAPYMENSPGIKLKHICETLCEQEGKTA